MTRTQPTLVLEINKGYPKVFGRTLPMVRESTPRTMIGITFQGYSLCRARNSIESLAIAKAYYTIANT